MEKEVCHIREVILNFIVRVNGKMADFSQEFRIVPAPKDKFSIRIHDEWSLDENHRYVASCLERVVHAFGYSEIDYSKPVEAS